MAEQSRREFIKTIGTAAASGALSIGSGIPLTGCRSGMTERPNVIIVLTDDQGYGDLGCHGNNEIKTPFLDVFHSQSVRFTNFYVCPLCSPTRSSLLTGRYNYRTGVIDTWVGWALLRPNEVTLAETFKEAGYSTGIFGKWHLGDHAPLRPVDQGFEECLIHKGAGMGGRANPPDNRYYDPILYRNEEPKKYQGYCTDIFFSAALEFIEQRGDRPFFVYIPTNVPHVPLEIKEEEVEPYLAMGLDEITAKHYAMLANFDWNFGRMTAKLKELGLEEKTIVIFMSDNGPAYGERRYNAGLREAKGSVYDGGIKVPFFIRWPEKLRAGKDIDRIAAHIDVMPTLMDLCRIEETDPVLRDGLSLSPLLTGSAADWPDRTLFFQQCRPDSEGIDRPRLFTNCAARSQRYKIVMTAENRRERQTKAIGFEETELFDMLRDPGEKTDISKEHPDIVRSMRQDYEAWFNDVTRDLEPVHIGLGSPNQNPVTLTNQDLFGPGSAANYSSYSRLSRNPAEEPEGYGIWNVQVFRNGLYRITLRLGSAGPQEVLPLKSGQAVFKLGQAVRTLNIEEGAGEIRFEIRLEKMKGELETYFTGQRRDGKKITPFFVDVELMGKE